MSNLYFESELYHYGVKGMKWGVRRTKEQLGYKNLKKSKAINMDRWGKSADTNVLYIGGYSGSGKSTTAQMLANENTDVIHLDAYMDEYPNGEGAKYRNKNFDRFLKKNGIETPISKTKQYSPFEEAIEKFGSEQYGVGRRVIAEGIQVIDDGVHVDKSFYANKPTMLLATSPLESMRRAFARDGTKPTPKNIAYYINWYSTMNKQIGVFVNDSHVDAGRNWIESILKE